MKLFLSPNGLNKVYISEVTNTGFVQSSDIVYLGKNIFLLPLLLCLLCKDMIPLFFGPLELGTEGFEFVEVAK